MGSPYDEDGAEDDACAEHIEDLLRARTPDRRWISSRVVASTAARHALDPSIDWITPGDLECALDIDRFDFAMRAQREDGLWIARTESARG